MDHDGIATVVDRSGRLTAHIHAQVLQSDLEVRSGTVLVLKDAVVVATASSRSINVHADNVVVAFPPDTTPPHFWGQQDGNSRAARAEDAPRSVGPALGEPPARVESQALAEPPAR
eukprot:CAMPEP_0197409570 /NCGR_PEP_ID=MMETSP1165-20131217/30097_1 /TAXON_ID=284809 /ORGANISM="Chrysocystis fragilis, Strain CCMP3189" /LENGTH=115 /DNA_ID=CAMNT_0042936037 /DNA_START=1 /DNA_END=344 /DNA_ORIENTATION=-